MVTTKLMQGDSRIIPFDLFLNGSESITPELVEDVELCIQTEYDVRIRKMYSDGSLSYDGNRGKWYFRLSQNETISLAPETYKVIARSKFSDDVIGIDIGRIQIVSSASNKVI